MLSKNQSFLFLVRENYSRYIDSSMVLASYGPEKNSIMQKKLSQKKQ
jgi:hypothetical protein